MDGASASTRDREGMLKEESKTHHGSALLQALNAAFAFSAACNLVFSAAAGVWMIGRSSTN
eukprot:1156722-Pelagomonas_calceolata.AAC.4